MRTAWGVHAARGVAMVGMTVAHFVDRDGSESGLDLVRPAVDGRAMCLFVVLAGVGLSLLTARRPMADVELLARGAVLLGIGIGLTILVGRIAIILDEYALFFVLAVGLRRLADRALLIGSVALIGTSGVAIQLLGRDYRIEWLPVPELIEQYLLTGYYPVAPTAGYLMVGMWIGRQDLFDRSLWVRLAGLGVVMIALTDLGARLLADAADVDRATADDGTFTFARMLDTSGHSGMLAANLAALGSALVALSVCSLIAAHSAALLRPLISIGRIALTFYVGQALLSDQIPFDQLSLGQEYALVALIVLAAWAGAEFFLRSLGRGPLEEALRSVSTGVVQAVSSRPPSPQPPSTV